MSFQDHDIFTAASKNLKELIQEKKAALFAFRVTFENEGLKFTHIKKMSSAHVQKSIQDSSLAIVCKDTIYIAYEFALAHELTRGQLVQNPLRKAVSPATVLYLAVEDKLLIFEQLNDYIAMRASLEARKLQRIFSFIHLELDKKGKLHTLSKKIHWLTRSCFIVEFQKPKPTVKHFNRNTVIIPREMLSEFKKRKKIGREK
ncbi:MAG: hypothetical protein LLF94_09250 [Chlamydiales bacterium]|nr:hypothetical protein [Chlamydiales bacterium]